MYEDLLFPYDGSEGATEALHHASEIAHWAGATLHVVYVADTTRDSVTVVDGDTVDVLERAGEDVIEEAAETLDTLGVPYDTDIVQGNPAPTIVDYADRYEQDLIVIPTHGREGLSRYLVGSVAEKVVRLSSVPVLTVRMQPDETFTFPYENVMIPTDGSDDAVNAAEHTLSLAASLGATVHVLSVVDDLGGRPDLRSTRVNAETERAANDAVAAIVEAADERGLTGVVRHVEHGTPVEEILDCVASNGIDMVGMGTTGRRGTDRILLGSVAEKTVRSVPIPVLTVRASGAESD